MARDWHFVEHVAEVAVARPIGDVVETVVRREPACWIARRLGRAARQQVVPDRADWTYALAAPASFRVFATRDGHPIALPSVTWKLGPEMLEPAEEKTVALPVEGLTTEVGPRQAGTEAANQRSGLRSGSPSSV